MSYFIACPDCHNPCRVAIAFVKDGYLYLAGACANCNDKVMISARFDGITPVPHQSMKEAR